MKKMFVFIALFSRCYSLQAQFNDSTHYYLKYATTGIINRTNDARSFVLNNALAFQVNKKKLTVNSSNAWIYGMQDGALTNNDFSTALNADYLRNVRKLYYWALTSYTTSFSLKMRYQFQAGAGVGYNIIRRENAELEVSDGFLYESSDLKLENDVRDIYQTVRNSLRIKYRWDINKLVVLEAMHFWQPSLMRIDDYIIRSSNSLSVKLRKWLSLTTSLTYNKLSRTNRENLLLNFGVTAEKYF